MENHDIECILEGILFVSGEPVAISRIASVLGITEDELIDAYARLRDRYAFERRGIRLVRLDSALQMCSSPEYADYIRLALEARKPPQLTPPALEVLAATAYFQPVTRAYIEQIRGVDSAYTVGMLQDRGLIEPCGRLAAPGRPVLYRTTPMFLRVFGMTSLKELPPLPEIADSGDEKLSIQNAILALRERVSDGAAPDTEEEAV